MFFANAEAQRFHHERIDAEHILLGLLKEGTGTAMNVLVNRRIDRKHFQAELERRMHPGPELVVVGQLPYTQRAKNVIEKAGEEAHQFGHNYLGTEHLPPGILHEREGVAADVLREVGLTLPVARDEVLKLLSGPKFDSLTVKTEKMGGVLTERANKVVELARQEAGRFSHDSVKPEHLLLGLVKEGAGVAACVLKNFGVELRGVRIEVEKLVKPAPSSEAEPLLENQISLSDSCKEVIENAVRECQELGHRYVGTEHLLLGLVRGKDNLAVVALMNLGVTPEMVRKEVLAVLGVGVQMERLSENAEGAAEHVFQSLKGLPVEVLRVVSEKLKAFLDEKGE